MSLAIVRGGVPHIFRSTVSNTAATHIDFRRLAKGACNYMKIRNTGANVLRVYFSVNGETLGEYIEIPVKAADAPYGEWEGPVEAVGVYLKANGGSTTSELVVFERRG